uniref:Uncharacterized protein n=1 Tax=Rhodosorus marinus TaxID=101924 RepID=A0A7S3E6Z5_9RHOD|mmetsp:Transcript_13101/g.52182  ORF Transcript_13101/g.52182 Transcript_13101/m.52182 type:complete len:134 (+) Transcript_13101:537-938(+)|eukprot:CAMPEP_0113967730 /NCGR_PEP_ID=MMETSP0011_2-20120614/9110_1 /TAXON_ID=101924 /ORGANISM="Rhodosorus marinus" /LENGTH=133 /DNA_ID=CAMNT_0000980681 /DNA_START=1134 /DNA_END=1535 /DNA_ORIENTATION=+ /assembly_acc=CAM_ASM_000156
MTGLSLVPKRSTIVRRCDWFLRGERSFMDKFRVGPGDFIFHALPAKIMDDHGKFKALPDHLSSAKEGRSSTRRASTNTNKDQGNNREEKPSSGYKADIKPLPSKRPEFYRPREDQQENPLVPLLSVERSMRPR